MDVWQLSEIILIPPRIISVLREKIPQMQQHCDLIRHMTESEYAENAYQALANALGADDMAMLACQLEAAKLYYERFSGLGVSHEILVDTLKCFRRFLDETRAMKGEDAFDRAWWTWRQVSGRLFRIGQLEYEMLPETGEISLHIPSDAVFTPEQVDASLGAAKLFFAEFFPEYSDAHYVCHSWLMSPKLRELLPENSNIVAFQNRFAITHVDPHNRDYIGWLFRATGDTPPEALPEDTSLRRKAKQLLLSGGNIGEAGGILL